MHKKKGWIGAIALVLVIGLLIWRPWIASDANQQSAKVTSGVFETYISAVGELQAQKALDITVPEVSFRREINIWALKIMNIVEEGKIVKKGDHVATLEPTEVEENLVNVNQRLDQLYNSLEDAKLDSSLTLSEARNSIQRAYDQLLDQEIKVEQSIYESKAVQRQAKIGLEKAERSLTKSRRDLDRRRRKLKMQIRRYEDKVKRHEFEKNLLEQLRSELSITAPADGMVVYGVGYNGQKVKVGSRVGRWAPLIATLPDLNSLVSEMFVKEIDIAKVRLGQKVRMKIDAFPNKEYLGEILNIANIGQEIPGEFQNGFKVLVKLASFTDALLPGMTTSNQVVTGSWNDALYVPKEAVYGNDSIRYVVRKLGLKTIRQQVILGDENEESVRIEKGLEENQRVLLDKNVDHQKLELVTLD
ncbi:MAG: HlyD family efflux transporter periplasmic adaptor subunit [Marinilabiliaceae bacterium]|nr:HlyD family efflux transporter periplasmic adaptor subunit [Marinilabiliaceae bacterium]